MLKKIDNTCLFSNLKLYKINLQGESKKWDYRCFGQHFKKFSFLWILVIKKFYGTIIPYLFDPE